MKFAILDVRISAARHEFERAFYEAFAPVTGNRLIRQLWIWDDAKRRLRTRVPYKDQIIYVMRDETGRLHTAVAVNCRLARCQSAAFGFPRPAGRRRTGEILTFFTLRARLSAYALYRRFFEGFCLPDLARRGITRVVATGTERMARAYLRMGCRLVAKTEVAGEMRCYIEFVLGRDGNPQLRRRARAPRARPTPTSHRHVLSAGRTASRYRRA